MNTASTGRRYSALSRFVKSGICQYRSACHAVDSLPPLFTMATMSKERATRGTTLRPHFPRPTNTHVGRRAGGHSSDVSGPATIAEASRRSLCGSDDQYGGCLSKQADPSFIDRDIRVPGQSLDDRLRLSGKQHADAASSRELGHTRRDAVVQCLFALDAYLLPPREIGDDRVHRAVLLPGLRGRRVGILNTGPELAGYGGQVLPGSVHRLRIYVRSPDLVAHGRRLAQNCAGTTEWIPDTFSLTVVNGKHDERGSHRWSQ